MKKIKKTEIRKELEVVRNINGGVLQPRDVVRYAKNPITKLHSCFTWDNKIASDKWREHEATILILVQVEKVKGRDVRLYVNLTNHKRGGGFTLSSDALPDKMLKKIWLEQVRDEMLYFIGKFHNVAEVERVRDAMNEALKSIEIIMVNL